MYVALSMRSCLVILSLFLLTDLPIVLAGKIPCRDLIIMMNTWEGGNNNKMPHFHHCLLHPLFITGFKLELRKEKIALCLNQVTHDTPQTSNKVFRVTFTYLYKL